MTEITSPEIKKLKETKNLATFEIGPLFPGFGVTVGNALRRVMFSSLEGYSSVAVKIKGAAHEFTTLPGVEEDVIRIILNLKMINFKLVGTDLAVLKLNEKGTKKVTAKNFEKNSSVEIINPDQEIANLSKNGELSLEITIKKGIGYVPSERADKEKKALGTITLDANYSPIELINFKVEDTRVGQMTNYNKVVMDIKTDGSIKPEEAIEKAASILVSQFSDIAQKAGKKPQKKLKEVKKDTGYSEAVKKMQIEELGLSSRTTNALLSANIKNVGSLIKNSDEKLASLDGVGAKAIEEIKKRISKL